MIRREVVMVDKGQNQTVVRDNNMKLILFSLLEKSMSCSDLAGKLLLSKPAVTKITSEMLDLDLIVSGGQQDSRSAYALGRKKSYLSINENVGVVAAIDFSTVNIRVGLYSLSGREIVVRELLDAEFITEGVLSEVAELLRSLLQESCAGGRELLCLCIGASGKIDKRTGNIVESIKFRDCRGINIKEFFETRFDVEVLVKNDMDLSLLAEKKYGALRGADMDDAVLLYIDSGIGGAVLSDGNILAGRHGFAGEFGLAVTVDDDGSEQPYDCIVSINALKDKIRSYQRESGEQIFAEKFRFRDVVKKFQEGQPAVRKIVLRSADIVARLIVSLIDILDTDRIILSGRVRAFGDAYLQQIKGNEMLAARSAEVLFSRTDNSVLLGAVFHAIEAAFDILITRRRMDINLRREA